MDESKVTDEVNGASPEPADSKRRTAKPPETTTSIKAAVASFDSAYEDLVGIEKELVAQLAIVRERLARMRPEVEPRPKRAPQTKVANVAPKLVVEANPQAAAPRGRKTGKTTAKAEAFCLKGKPKTPAQVAAHLGIENTKASQILNQLKNKGRLGQFGERGPGFTYGAP